MKHRRVVIVCLSLMLTLMVVSASSIACEFLFDMVIENQTSQTLAIYLDGRLLGTVVPSANVTATGLPSTVNMFLVVAKSAQGETVFSKTLSRQQMQSIGKTRPVYKVVIPPQPSP
jgi:hypothetical protein